MKKIILFASGNGSNAQAIIDYFKDRQVIVSAIVCNNPTAGVIGRANLHHIPVILIDKKKANSNDFISQLKHLNPNYIILAGYLWQIPIAMVRAFEGRIINIHPALLPKYGGKGMYGSHVHQAVIENQENTSGISIHYVNEHYDEGAIIAQIHCNVFPEDTHETLAKRIHSLEHFFFPRTIDFILHH